MSIGPDALLANTYCLSEVSKDVNGQVIVLDVDQKQCKKPGCETLTLLQYLRRDLTSMLLIGTSLNSIGLKQSFVVALGEDIRASVLQSFADAWNKGQPVN